MLDSLATDAEQLLRVTNPHLKYYQNTLNGYLLLDLTPERLQAEFWMVPMVSERTDEQILHRAFSVASGVAHLMLEDEGTEPLADAPMLAP